jgi:hypothetical protein
LLGWTLLLLIRMARISRVLTDRRSLAVKDSLPTVVHAPEPRAPTRCRTKCVRFGVLLVALTLSAVAGGAAESAPSPTSSDVSCESVVDLVGSARYGERRITLGVISTPPAYLSQVVPTDRSPWRYFSKAGLLIRGDSPRVSVSVPKAWRSRVRIGWGDGGGSLLRFAPCPTYDSTKPWNAYTGGFSLRMASACVPLIFHAGKRSATVRFGLGRRCDTG